ncbi:hypothetical protein ACE1CI_31600 [Aerosakkonemataceae cyanobacterium BLCC-F50]|uniref:Uncharacterized protein n=1 Tax=Floridaenema flaviceps BLCC-F50 TaxID=3153642 RepID=A0ABV4Y0M3_9CYAN
MPKRFLQAVILTIIIKVLASTSSPNFPDITSARVSPASKTSITLLYHWLDRFSDKPNGRLRQRFTKEFDNRID